MPLQLKENGIPFEPPNKPGIRICRACFIFSHWFFVACAQIPRLYRYMMIKITGKNSYKQGKCAP